MKKIFIILITILLVITSVFVYQRKEENENDEMKRFAQNIADETDKDFEDVTINIIDNIKNDTLLQTWLKNNDVPSDDSILSYFDSKYFDNIDLYKNYNRSLIVCDSSITVNIYSYDITMDCISYHEEYLDAKKINENLFNIDDATSDIYYYAKINLDESKIPL